MTIQKSPLHANYILNLNPNLTTLEHRAQSRIRRPHSHIGYPLRQGDFAVQTPSDDPLPESIAFLNGNSLIVDDSARLSLICVSSNFSTFSAQA